MNIENVKALAEIVCAHGLTLLEVDDNKVRIEKGATAASKQVQPALEAVVPQTSANDQTVDYNHLVEIKSPMVGVFYSAPSPDAEMFVSIGSKVKKGDVLCIIEAMKLMTPVEADAAGTVVKVIVSDGASVEYGAPLIALAVES